MDPLRVSQGERMWKDEAQQSTSEKEALGYKGDMKNREFPLPSHTSLRYLYTSVEKLLICVSEDRRAGGVGIIRARHVS